MRDEVPLRRGMLLLVLHGQYPLVLTELVLTRQVEAFYSPREPRAFDRDVAFLADLGLLVVEQLEVGEIHSRTFVLTAAGVNVVEGATAVPGVTVTRG